MKGIKNLTLNSIDFKKLFYNFIYILIYYRSIIKVFNIENFLGIPLGSGFSLIAPYLIMFFILLIRPDGLFGREEVERV